MENKSNKLVRWEGVHGNRTAAVTTHEATIHGVVDVLVCLRTVHLNYGLLCWQCQMELSAVSQDNSLTITAPVFAGIQHHGINVEGPLKFIRNPHHYARLIS
jgi:hypothetical protein